MNRALAEQIAKAKANKSGNFIRDGGYLFEVLKLEADKKFKGNTFIAELKVLESRKTNPNVDPNPVGTTCAYITNLDDKYGLGMGNMKAFVMALYGVPEEEVTVDVLCEVTSDKQPATGMKIRDEAFSKPKKEKPSETFTHHRWENVPEEAAK